MLEVLEGRVNPSGLALPQHYPNIRLLETDYGPNTSYSLADDNLLASSVDLVVEQPTPNISAVAAIPGAPPQLIYANFSDLSRDNADSPGVNELTDFYQFAVAQNADPEDAFFHVVSPTSFSPADSSDEVAWFSRVSQGTLTPTPDLQDLTGKADGQKPGGIDFSNTANSGSIYLGYADPFTQININVTTPAAGGWNYEVQYANGVTGGTVNWNTLVSSPTPGPTHQTSAGLAWPVMISAK